MAQYITITNQKPIMKIMKKIIFVWSNVEFHGIITYQGKSNIQGQKTVIRTITPLEQEFTIYGKCEIGDCGPFKVLNIFN